MESIHYNKNEFNTDSRNTQNHWPPVVLRQLPRKNLLSWKNFSGEASTGKEFSFSPSNSENLAGLTNWAQQSDIWVHFEVQFLNADKSRVNFKLFSYTCNIRIQSKSPWYYRVLTLLSEIRGCLLENCNFLSTLLFNSHHRCWEPVVALGHGNLVS